MLNRRILRIKAMQALFAWHQASLSSIDYARDFIKDTFAPDLNSPEVQDLKKLEAEKNQALELFEQAIRSKGVFDSSSVEKQIAKSVADAYELLNKQKEKDKKHYLKLMKDDVNEIYRWYLYFLNFLPELVFFLKNEQENRKTKFIKDPSHNQPFHFIHNRISQLIQDNKELEKLRGKYNVNWDQDLVKKIFREYLNTDEDFIKYNSLKSSDFEADQKVILRIFKDMLFKDKNLLERFEEHDINWLENKSVVKSMVLKTLKSFDETSSPETRLLEISNNWEEDELFFTDLFVKAIEKDEFLEEAVGERTKNWNVERLAILDKVLLKLAISEMMNFPSIPVKVSINEYIEISKLYSTPKSRQFINGLLDKVALEFTQNGLIKKSGRGLIDNK